MPAMILTLVVTAPAAVDLLRRGEEAYRAGLARRAEGVPGDRGEAHFRDAARAWEALRRRGIDNALLQRNLGHAYFLAGDLPRSVLAYRLGLRRCPGDPALGRALAQARDRVAYPEGATLGRPDESAPPAWLSAAPPAALFALAAFAYAAGWACLMRWFMRRRSAPLVAGLALLAAAAAPAWLVIDRQRSGPAPPIAVIARDGVSLRKGNGASFPAWSAVPLNRGVEAEQILARGGWVQLRLAGGAVGWVHSSEVVVGDDPESFP